MDSENSDDLDSKFYKNMHEICKQLMNDSLVENEDNQCFDASKNTKRKSQTLHIANKESVMDTCISNDAPLT